MYNRALNYLRNIHALHRVNIALTKASLASNARNICPKTPSSWEFSGFSQNGEDGISDYLSSQLIEKNRYFFEIGSSDGIENNTVWFAIAKKYSGIMIEGNRKLSERSGRIIEQFNIGVNCENMFISQENIKQVINLSHHENPDIFSLDIDGNDYYVMKALLENGFRPKICIVEYNSVFGPEKIATIPYAHDFFYLKAHSSGLYYGVSIAAWKKLFFEKGYKFVTVDSRGVNAFFVEPTYFEKDFIENLAGIDFQENFYQFQKYRSGYQKQFEEIKHLPLYELV